MANPLNPGTLVASLYADMGGTSDIARVTAGADAGALESQLITFPAGDGATQGDFVVLTDVAGNTIAVWLDIDADGTAPNGTAANAADAKVEVDIVAAGTPSTAAQVAAAAKTAIETDATLEDVTIVDNGDGTLTITQDLMGAIADAVPSNSAENGAGSILAETVTEGADSNFQDTHFTLEDEDGNAFYAWFNVNGEGTDPAETGTGLEVAIAAGASAASVGAAIASAVDARAEFDADHDGNGVVKIAVVGEGNAVDITAGDAPVTVSMTQQGSAGIVSAAGSPADISNNPAAF